ncbi:DUF3297 family protein [Pararoseomonas sp. SCSIO 73927]|uniref:DUF3297 family protein n=1 Tax=Pararoseomonas sp. SCSIO 73927 TaxID=3114537 RepID=UPI0030CCE781
MTDTPPDRLSADPASPFFDQALLERGVGIRFKGVEKTNVEEYCVSEGWVRLSVGKAVDRKGKPMTMKLQGKVEPYFREPAAPADEARAEGAAPDA